MPLFRRKPWNGSPTFANELASLGIQKIKESPRTLERKGVRVFGVGFKADVSLIISQA